MMDVINLLKDEHVGKSFDFSVHFQVVELGPTGGSNKKKTHYWSCRSLT